PELLLSDRRDRAFRRVRTKAHVPYHAVGHRRIERSIHPDGDCAAASERTSHTSANTGEAEVIAHHRNAGLAQTLNDRLYVFEVLLLLRTIEEHIVPMSRIEVLDGFELQALSFNGLAQVAQFLERPQFVRVACESPALVGAGGLVVRR